MMQTRLLSLAIVGVFSMSAQAQLPSDRYSPINYIGRFTGFGYSDGYHACKDGQCNTRGSWKNWDPMGVSYTYPASPPPRTTPIRTMVVPPQQSIAHYYEMQQAIEPSPVIPQPMYATEPSPQTFQPPMQPVTQPAMTQPPQWNAVPKSTLESVPPAPIQIGPQAQPSPSDLRNLVPESATRRDTLPAPPTVPPKKSTEARSIMRPSSFRF